MVLEKLKTRSGEYQISEPTTKKKVYINRLKPYNATIHTLNLDPFLPRFRPFSKIELLNSVKIDILSHYRHKNASETEVLSHFGH